jgi:hypothetical protein
MAILLPLFLFVVVLLGYGFLFVGRRARNLPHGQYRKLDDVDRITANQLFEPRSANIANHWKPSPDSQERSASEVSVLYNITKTQLTRFRFTEWAKQYGGMYSLKLGTGTAVVLTDRRLIKQLLDKKSNIYSNRPPSFVSHDLITGGDHLLVMQYGNMWRSFRKLIHQYFMESMVEKEHIVLQNAEAVQMVHDYMLYPEEHMRHPKRYSNSIIMSLRKSYLFSFGLHDALVICDRQVLLYAYNAPNIPFASPILLYIELFHHRRIYSNSTYVVYGIRTPTINTSHMTRLYDLMENWSVVMEPGNTPPVDIYPFLHWVPESVFGNWRSRASNVGDEMNKLYADTLDKVDERRKHNNSNSFMDKVLDQNEKLGLSRHQLYFLGGVCMEGGSDTSSSVIIAFVQAMTKFPEILKKAQKEIDSVVGEDRSPVWSDYDKLPYIATCVKEAQRWRPVVPTAFPHTLIEGTPRSV